MMAIFAVFALNLDAETAPNRAAGIVPNRYIVVYRTAAVPGDAEVRARAMGVHMLRHHDRLGIATVEGAGQPASSSPASSRAVKIDDDRGIMQRLAAQPNVEYVLHDRIVTSHRLRVQAVPSDGIAPVFAIATGVTAFDTYYNSPQGWAVRQAGGYGNSIPGGPARGPWDTTTGKGVRIAILDSGVDSSHPDIAPNLILNLSEVDQSVLPSMCDDGSPRDQAGHGTWTASLAAAALGPGTGRVVGVAPSASILNIKVLERLPATLSGGTDTARCSAGESTGLLSWVIQGIDDAIANHADVISMSLGATIDLATGDGAGVKAAFDRITYAAAQAGTVLVAAAGNDGYNLSNPRYIEIPAQSRGVLAVVASTNPDCMEDTNSGASCTPGPPSLAYYSNYGAPLNALAAPGGSYPSGGDMAVSGWVRGACSSGLPNTQDGLPNDQAHSFGCFNLGHTAYVQAIGTSAAAPLVAGAAALLRAAHPEWDSATVVTALRTAAAPATTRLPIPQINLPSALSYH
jgi:subtilisin family serine protease